MYDLLLRGGRVIDPASGHNAIADVAFEDGKVARIGPDLDRNAKEIKDVGGAIVTPGLIDLHTHVYWGGTSIGVDPDAVARQSAATTLVDAGTAGPANIAGFRAHVIEPATVRVLPFLNISFPGIFAFSRPVMYGECINLELLNARECVAAARAHAELVVGIKVRVGANASGPNGHHPLDIALEVADELELPLMAHLDYPPPTRKEVLERLRPGDILTHCFRPFPASPADGRGNVREEVRLARERGIVFDIGHGQGSFGFETCRAMLAGGFEPDTISSDVHSISIDGPAYDLLVTMSKFLCLGMGIDSVVRATTVAAADAVRRPELGRLTEGGIGDASVIQIEDGEFDYVDVLGERMAGDKGIVARGTVQGGAWTDPA
ncbi:MAG: amidohydrolase/deacetylase family metallohydrolase [Alphaproteobacteria bacterium]|jgi:dihydroorotase|nr:amidohydrolase/deacetylase family metallohydrolase [Alphaproteobacteria bacterium]